MTSMADRSERRERPTSFSAFFRDYLLPRLRKHERVRRVRLPLLIVSTLGYAALAAWTFFTLPIQYMLGVALLGIVLTSLEGSIFLHRRRKVLFSTEVVAPLVRFAASGMQSWPAYYVSQGDFMESGLFGYTFDRYEGRDYFSGDKRGYQLSFSWIKVEYAGDGKIVDNRRRRRQREIFTGWFFVAVFPRHFLGGTMVQRDVAEAGLGWMGRSVQAAATHEGMELVLLEDAEFERRFKVQSTGQLEARYILSPAFMRLATAVDKRTNGGLSFAFHRNCLYAAVRSPIEYFTWRPTTPFTDPAFARLLYHAVVGVDEMARHILKHQRVWLDSPF